jgi:hypothetical protein
LENKTNRKKLASLSRWHTSHKSNGLVFFDDCIKKIKAEQEVLLCDDPIDEYVFNF